MARIWLKMGSEREVTKVGLGGESLRLGKWIAVRVAVKGLPMIRPILGMQFLAPGVARLAAAGSAIWLSLALGVGACAQQTAPAPVQPDVAQQPATTDAASGAPATAPAQEASPQQQAAPVQTNEDRQAGQAESKLATGKPKKQKVAEATGPEAPGDVTEEELKQLLVGKDLYLRGGYLADSISFNEHGGLFGHSPYGSYTLCGVRIDKVHLSKHKLELEGARYGLHFLGAMPYEDPSKAMDRVRITPKKKMLKITIDREMVAKAKKEKEPKPAKKGKGKAEAGAPASEGSAPTEMSEADEKRAEMAATPAEERPADWASVTTTTSPAHAKQMLLTAIENVFATGLDDRMLAAMPKFWQLYYQAAAAKTDYRPLDPAVLRQNMVDQKAKLLTKFEPSSNEYAQANGVAGMSLYHVVIGPDGKPVEIAVARPIGFGLDENAVKAIQSANFSPAVKDGKPVAVLLDLVVQFRIYSKRTAVTGLPEPADKPPVLPGPYSVQRP